MRNKIAKISMLVIILTMSLAMPILSVSTKKKYWVLDPIYINESIPEYSWAYWSTQPWCEGSGTEEEPYLIKDVIINGEGSTFCMTIWYSQAFFIIMDCIFYNTKPSPGERNAGLSLIFTSNGKVFNNQFIGNGWSGLALASGIALVYSSNNVIQKNYCSKNAGPGIYLEYSNENIISQNRCYKNEGVGIALGWSSSNQLIKNICTKNNLGIILFNYCEDNEIDDNTCSDNKQYGIQIWINSNYNRIMRNYCSDNLLTGILVGASNGNIIYDNNCRKNGESGISLIDLYDMNAGDNVIYGNFIYKNLKGISFSSVENNDIYENDIRNNVYGIIFDWECYNNLVYHNNFIKNEIDAWDAQTAANFWYHPYMLEGNYWFDYTGEDLDDDGIGDTLLPWLGLDEYSFMVKNGWEYLTTVEEEIMNVVMNPESNRLAGGRSVNPEETSYLIIGLGQALSERIYREWCPPYTVDIDFYGFEFQGTFWYFDEEAELYSEPALWQYFYIIFEPYQLLDLGLARGEWFYFDWWISFYSYDEYNEWRDLTSATFLI